MFSTDLEFSISRLYAGHICLYPPMSQGGGCFPTDLYLVHRYPVAFDTLVIDIPCQIDVGMGQNLRPMGPHMFVYV